MAILNLILAILLAFSVSANYTEVSIDHELQSRQNRCLGGVTIIEASTILHPYLLVIDQVFQFNTVLNIDGITINIDNAPTSVQATFAATSTEETLATRTVSSEFPPATFVLQLSGTAVQKRQVGISAPVPRYLLSDGSTTTTCGTEVEFVLFGGQLSIGGSVISAYPGDKDIIFGSTSSGGSITTTFTTDGGIQWTNDAFANGSAVFMMGSTGNEAPVVRAVFDGASRSGYEVITLTSFAGCPGTSTTATSSSSTTIANPTASTSRASSFTPSITPSITLSTTSSAAPSTTASLSLTTKPSVTTSSSSVPTTTSAAACQSTGAVAAVLQLEASGVPFCSSYLSLVIGTATANGIVVETPAAQLVTLTQTPNVVTVTQIDQTTIEVDIRFTSTSYTVDVISRQASTSIAIAGGNKRRQLEGYAPAEISSACLCLSLPGATSTISGALTSTLVAGFVTITKTALPATATQTDHLTAFSTSVLPTAQDIETKFSIVGPTCSTAYPPAITPAAIGVGHPFNPRSKLNNPNEGFLGFTYSGLTAPGAIAYEDPQGLSTDYFIWMRLPDNYAPANQACSSFGYIYHYNSGLCVGASMQSSSFPRFNGANYELQYCDVCGANETGPEQGQLFCTLGLPGDAISGPVCVAFLGDSPTGVIPYALLHTAAGVPSSMIYQNGDCLYMDFTVLNTGTT